VREGGRNKKQMRRKLGWCCIKKASRLRKCNTKKAKSGSKGQDFSRTM
jgi:hypothetical protein